MDVITPCLWFDGAAVAAATYYVSLFPDSRIDHVARSTVDYPGGKIGDPLMVSFTLAGRAFQGMNGGPNVPFTEAVSMSIATKDQAETDRLWDALIADGGAPVQCGWLKDRWGLRWQVVPERLLELIKDSDTARASRAMAAMVQMVKIDIAAIEAAVEGVPA